MKLGMKSYIQIMIKSLNLAKNFKLMLPLSFNTPTVCLSCIFQNSFSRSKERTSSQKQVLKN